jgi:hypothetical protein
VAALESERRHRRERSAAEIAGCLVDTLSILERATLADDADSDELQARLTGRLQNRIRARERSARTVVESLYRHAGLEHGETSTSDLLGAELFTEEGWELFGLSHNQLLVSGALSGAVAGGGVDLMLGGATFLLGAGIGAIIGGIGAWFGGDELAKVKVLGQSLGGRILQVGPVTAPNFPWVLLGRALVHHRLVAERNHARREVLSLALVTDQHFMDTVADEVRRRLGKVFKAAADPAGPAGASTARQTLTREIAELLVAQSSGPDSASR